MLLKALDAELQQIYLLQIGIEESKNLRKSKDLSHSAQIQIQVLDLNDFIPTFDKELYKFKLQPNATIGSVIGQVDANDQDLMVLIIANNGFLKNLNVFFVS